MISQVVIEPRERKVRDEMGEERDAFCDRRFEFFGVPAWAHGLAVPVLLGAALAGELAGPAVGQGRVAFDLFATAASTCFVQASQPALFVELGAVSRIG